uniref:T9SS type A sorting domain-containing protein n=1 Tax=Flavobacterium sp. TaxID=239 RepID=UPI00404765FF
INSGKIFITTKSSLDKKVEIFNVLGKKVLETVITSKEVNIGQLEAGIYIIKIKEGDASATRKLIVN